MHKSSLHGMFWVLSLCLLCAGCAGETVIHLHKVPGVVERVDSMSREEALQILERCVNPPGLDVEPDGLRLLEQSHMGYYEEVVSGERILGYPGGYRGTKVRRYGKIVDVHERFYAFEDMYRVVTFNEPKDEEEKKRWVYISVAQRHVPSGLCVALTAHARHQDLDLEYRDLLAALYKLCPSLRQGPGDSDVGDAAGRQLSDQAQLAKIAVEDKDALVRAAATRKLTDQILLAKIAVRDKDALVRAAAAKQLAAQKEMGQSPGQTENQVQEK